MLMNDEGIQRQGLQYVPAMNAERFSPKLKAWNFIKLLDMLVYTRIHISLVRALFIVSFIAILR